MKLSKALIIVSCCFFVAFPIDILVRELQYREPNEADHITVHYGDLDLEGGPWGTGWGWLECNKLFCWTNMVVEGYQEVYRDIYVYDDIFVYDDLRVYGSKYFVHPHPLDTTKVIKYISVESGEALTLLRGTASTRNGEVRITFPEHFSLVTSNTAPLTTLLTPKKAPVLLYVAKETNASIIVKMKSSDYDELGDVEFSYQVTGVRDGFEDSDVIVDIDETGKDESNISLKREEYNEKVKKIENKMKDISKKEREKKMKQKNEVEE